MAPRAYEDLTNLLCVGLTGGIGCGKSTVSRMLGKRSCLRLDADKLAHTLMEPGRSGWKEIVAHFGKSILAWDQRIDRAKLGARVFADELERRTLESILHPQIIQETQRRLHRWASEGENRVVLIEAALMLEAGTWERYDRLIVVHVPEAVQVARMKERGLEPHQTRARIAAQMPLEEKIALADYPLDNSGSWKSLEEKVVALHACLLEDLEAKMEGAPLPERSSEGI